MVRRSSQLPTTSLTFTYEVVDQDNASRLSFSALTGEDTLSIEDGAGNVGLYAADGKTDLAAAAVQITGGASQKIDTKSAVVVNVRRSLSDEDDYGLGDKVNIVVEFDEPVVVSGKPQLRILVGENAELISYVSGSGTRALTYQWTVPAGIGGMGENSKLSIQVPDDPHFLGSASIKDVGGNNVDLTDGDTANDLGDTTLRVDSRAPKVKTVERQNCAGDLVIGSGCEFKVTFDELLTVTSESSIELGFTLAGAKSGGTSRTAKYLTREDANDETSLTFAYTFKSSDMPTATTDAELEVGVPANGLKAGGTITDRVGNKADRRHEKVDKLPIDVADAANDGRDDGTSPSVTGPLEITGGQAATVNNEPKRLYKSGSKIGFVVTFSEDISYTGTVKWNFKIGGAAREASASSAVGRRLPFRVHGKEYG